MSLTPLPYLLKPRTLIYYMRAQQLRDFRDELERMHEAGDRRQCVLDTYEYVVDLFEKRRINPKARPKAMLSASSVYSMKSSDVRTLILKLESKASMTEEEHNTLQLLRGEENRRRAVHKRCYQKRRSEVVAVKEALCSTP